MRLRKYRGNWPVSLLWTILLLLALSGADSRNAGAEQTAALETLLPGVWRGVQTSGYTTYHLRLEVRREGKAMSLRECPGPG